MVKKKTTKKKATETSKKMATGRKGKGPQKTTGKNGTSKKKVTVEKVQVAKTANNDDGTMNKTEFASLLGISHNALLKNIANRKMSTLEDGRINVEQAVAQLRENIDWSHPGVKMRLPDLKTKHPGSASVKAIGPGDNQNNSRNVFNKARAMKESFLARSAELNFKERNGLLVDAQKIKSAHFAIARKVRDQFLNIPDRIMSQLAAESDQLEIRRILLEEIKTVLEGVVPGEA